MSLNDPLDTFLKSNGKQDSIKSCSVSSKDAMQMCPTILWRLDPEDSYSDWKIILELDSANMDVSNEYVHVENENQPSDLINEQEGDVEGKNGTCGAKNDGDNGNTDLSDETASLTNIFYVHRNILASESTYFRSLFKKRKYNQTSEHQTQTSIIKLHPQAIQSFPVFLDYIYNCAKEKLGIQRSNAVALRHLAMYFGVDKLMKEISELILLDFRGAIFRKDYDNDATLFDDEKLLQGIRLQRAISESLLVVAPGICRALSENSEVWLKEEGNSVLSSWRHVMRHISDSSYNAFFRFRNAEKFPNICVTGAGLDQLNGTYNLYGDSDGVVAYTNGVCFIEKKKDIWFFSVGFVDRNRDRREYFNLYKVASDTDYPPSTGWNACNYKYLPAPEIVSM